MSETNEPSISGQQGQTFGPWEPWGGSPTPIARIGDLEAGTAYQIRVRKIFSGQEPSPWSTVITARTDAS